MSVLKFKVPGKDEPGFLRRQRQALKFRGDLMSDPSAEVIDEMIEWLVQYVEEPQDREEASEALLDATEEQFFQLIELIGSGANPPK